MSVTPSIRRDSFKSTKLKRLVLHIHPLPSSPILTWVPSPPFIRTYYLCLPDNTLTPKTVSPGPLRICLPIPVSTQNFPVKPTAHLLPDLISVLRLIHPPTSPGPLSITDRPYFSTVLLPVESYLRFLFLLLKENTSLQLGSTGKTVVGEEVWKLLLAINDSETNKSRLQRSRNLTTSTLYYNIGGSS